MSSRKAATVLAVLIPDSPNSAAGRPTLVILAPIPPPARSVFMF